MFFKLNYLNDFLLLDFLLVSILILSSILLLVLINIKLFKLLTQHGIWLKQIFNRLIHSFHAYCLSLMLFESLNELIIYFFTGVVLIVIL